MKNKKDTAKSLSGVPSTPTNHETARVPKKLKHSSGKGTSMIGNGENNEIALKITENKGIRRKKKRKKSDNCIPAATGHGIVENGENSKIGLKIIENKGIRRKKKKSDADDQTNCIPTGKTIDEKSAKTKKKKKRRDSKEPDASSFNGVTDRSEDNGDESTLAIFNGEEQSDEFEHQPNKNKEHPPKRYSKVNIVTEPPSSCAAILDQDSLKPTSKKVKKSKKRKHDQIELNKESSVEQLEVEVDMPRPKKKKKNKHNLSLETTKANSSGVAKKSSIEEKLKLKTGEEAPGGGPVNVTEPVPKRPKKKKKKHRIEATNGTANGQEIAEKIDDDKTVNSGPETVFVGDTMVQAQKIKKKKKRDASTGFSHVSQIPVQNEENINNGQELTMQNGHDSTTERKVKKKKGSTNSVDRQTQPVGPPDTDIAMKTEKHKKHKKGPNFDNGAVDKTVEKPTAQARKKKRKTKPQNEGELNSSSEPVTEEREADNDKLGQWGTAELSDTKQQEKFMRLLGGLKSGDKSSNTSTSGGESILSRLSGVSKPANKIKLWGIARTEKKTFSSMALNAEQSQQLATKLEGQFNDTLAFNLQKRKEGNKAKGLGFEDPTQGKKHYIDVNKRKSVTLD